MSGWAGLGPVTEIQGHIAAWQRITAAQTRYAKYQTCSAFPGMDPAASPVAGTTESGGVRVVGGERRVGEVADREDLSHCRAAMFHPLASVRPMRV